MLPEQAQSTPKNVVILFQFCSSLISLVDFESEFMIGLGLGLQLGSRLGFHCYLYAFVANCIAKTCGQQYADLKAIYGCSIGVRILAHTGMPYADVKGTTMLGRFIYKFVCMRNCYA